MSRIPLLLTAGFLGAGKTTFLGALAQALRKQKVPFSIVVNDFADAEVDAARLRDAKTEVRALSGSCVCCSSLNDFIHVLRDIEVPPGGVLLVETNGASDLISLIAALTARMETRRFTSPLQLSLLDARRWQRRGEHDALEREQVQTATQWMLTHTEMESTERLASLRKEAAMLSPRAAETDAEKMAAYLKLLAATARLRHAPQDAGTAGGTLPFHIEGHTHHHEHERAFTAVKVDLPFIVKRRDLEASLQALPCEVLRVKGLCRLAELPSIPMSFQHVRPEAETWFLPMLDATAIQPTGVVIGARLPVKTVQECFAMLPSAELEPGPDVAP